ncbi:MAG: TetR/AcrR family transcriptional regulator [Paraburkholderia sp.]|uniref:TetR/AcrR family transcriptional regulator n=1 Tax=Paraburkholderia sp. TaxID=1926495 RepID=UPI003C361414
MEFDYTTALERATRLFWETGYASTSLRDLLKQMGIGEGSFYNTLKSKKNAYLECLKHYNATVNRHRGEAFFSAPTAALGVRALFESVLDCLDDPTTPSPVCLMAGSVTPEVLDEPDLRDYVQQQFSMLAERITARLNVDKEAGLLPAEFEPELVAPIVITYLHGLWRMALVSYSRSQFERQIDTFLNGLGL